MVSSQPRRVEASDLDALYSDHHRERNGRDALTVRDLDDGVVRLRPLRGEDWRITHVWRNDPEIRDGILGHRFPVTCEMEEEWVMSIVRNRAHDRAVYAVELMSEQLMIGMV